MVGENGVPETPDWSPTAKAWDDQACCPTDCPRICEHAVRTALASLDGTEASRISLISGLSIAEINDLGGLGEN